jgi:hypothetical protein
MMWQVPSITADVAKGPKRSVTEWSAAWESRRTSGIAVDDLGFIGRLAVVKKVKDRFTLLPVDTEEVAKASFIDIPDERDIAITRFVNRMNRPSDSTETTENPCEDSYQSIAACLQLDAVIDVTNKKWKLMGYNKAKKSMELLVESTGRSKNRYLEWLHRRLNYDGVIIDVDGDYLLALLPPGRGGSEIQALTLKDSSDRMILPKDATKGSSLLQLVERSGRYAVFVPVIMSDDAATSLVRGSKLIIERGKRSDD